jgi:predicted phage terminase large subunit-like protein
MTNLTPLEYEMILRQDFAGFIERSFYEINPGKKLMMADYINLIASRLEACRQGKIRRLIICIPPRYLKSHCVTVAFVAWLLGHNPSTQIICASYAQPLASKHALECRTLMLSPFYRRLFRTRLSPDKQAVDDFITTKHGFRMATSVGGVLTGRGADYIVIDDPLKPEDALSETQRTNVNRWYDNTLLSRLNDKANGCIIIVMQCLHQDDLVGHVLEQEVWDVLSLPAIAEQDEEYLIESPLGSYRYCRRTGEALHPERESLSDLAVMRETIGTYNFAAQYQQNPEPQGGAMVKKEWLRYYVPEERPAKFERIVQSWDTANKAGELNDYSVCTTWGEKNKHFYLLHVFRRRMEYPDLKRQVKEQARIYNASAVVIEDKASGTQLIQELMREGVSSITRYEPPACDKIMRLHGQTDAFENGLVLLPKEAPWLEDYLHEITTFPGSKHDDQVDSTTQALAWMRTPMPGTGLLEYYRQEHIRIFGTDEVDLK